MSLILEFATDHSPALVICLLPFDFTHLPDCTACEGFVFITLVLGFLQEKESLSGLALLSI